MLNSQRAGTYVPGPLTCGALTTILSPVGPVRNIDAARPSRRLYLLREQPMLRDPLMPRSHVNPLPRYVRQWVAREDVAHTPDHDHLDRFVRHHEEVAFAELVRRHGPAVWHVCRTVLDDHHTAEDAFQATFLVLAQK